MSLVVNPKQATVTEFPAVEEPMRSYWTEELGVSPVISHLKWDGPEMIPEIAGYLTSQMFPTTVVVPCENKPMSAGFDAPTYTTPVNVTTTFPDAGAVKEIVKFVVSNAASVTPVTLLTVLVLGA